jgi:hypothetical protein
MTAIAATSSWVRGAFTIIESKEPIREWFKAYM